MLIDPIHIFLSLKNIFPDIDIHFGVIFFFLMIKTYIMKKIVLPAQCCQLES